MKRMDIFCSSPASTAICSSIDQRSMLRRTHKPIFDAALADNVPHRRRSHRVPCSSHSPIDPTPRPSFEKSRKSTSSSYSYTTIHGDRAIKRGSSEARRKSSADILDLKSSRRDSSSRCLLGEPRSAFVLDWLPERPTVDDGLTVANSNPTSALVKSSSTNRSRHQVVVLRVSLHCKGCEGKVRKHLSKMEGVTSFSVDLAAKKVTVIGDVTPLGVLASVSKVKNAQLWPCPTSSSLPSSPWSA